MRITARRVIEGVAERHGLKMKDFESPARYRRLAWPRQEAYFEAYVQCPHISLPEIGRICGNRDHTTIRFGIIKHAKRIGLDYEDIKRSGPIAPRFSPRLTLPVSASDYREMARL